MKISELLKQAKKIGCYLVEHGKKHDLWFSPVTNKYFRVPRHQNQELKSGIEHSIKKDAGLE